MNKKKKLNVHCCASCYRFIIGIEILRQEISHFGMCNTIQDVGHDMAMKVPRLFKFSPKGWYDIMLAN